MNAAALATLYGTDEALPPEVALRAGPLCMTLRGSHIVDMKVAGHEVWHGVSFLYRDPDWGTPEPVFDRITHEVDGDGDGFTLRLEGRIPTEPVIDLLLTLKGDAQGAVEAHMRAVPRADMLANRVGLCVMHPMHAIGRTLEVEHVDGRISRSVFPAHVPPWPPFKGISGIRHEFAPGHWAQVRFRGDDFEFEDQRNNADASFKTYSRSNDLPRPYLLRGGVAIEQSLRLHLETAPSPLHPAPAQRGPVRVADSAKATRMPQLGLAITPADAQALPPLLAALAELSPALLHLTLTLPDQSVDWVGIAQLLSISKAGLRLDLSAGVTAASLGRLVIGLRDAAIAPESIAIFAATPEMLAATRMAFPDAAIGSGTPHFFAQFNRMDEVGTTDFLSFTVCPIVHSAGDAAPMAGLQSLPSLLVTARARYPGRALRIGPSSLGARSSPLGSQPASDGTRRIALAQRDPRTRGLYGAAWLLGHVTQAASGGAESVSVMSLRGDAGVLEETVAGQLVKHPTFFVLAQLARMKQLNAVTVSNSAGIAAIASIDGDRPDWLMANLTSQAVEMAVGSIASALVMDVGGWQAYVASKAASPWRVLHIGQAGIVRLEAFGIARLS